MTQRFPRLRPYAESAFFPLGGEALKVLNAGKFLKPVAEPTIYYIKLARSYLLMWRIPPRLTPVVNHIWVLPATIKATFSRRIPKLGFTNDQQDMSILIRRFNSMVVRQHRKFGRLGVSSVRF